MQARFTKPQQVAISCQKMHNGGAFANLSKFGRSKPGSGMIHFSFHGLVSLQVDDQNIQLPNSSTNPSNFLQCDFVDRTKKDRSNDIDWCPV